MKTALLPQLHVFLAVARLRSFSGAARELGVSTAAVSQSVRQMEEQLRGVLLTRTTRSMSLTEAGRRLVEEADPGLGQALAALHHASAQPGEAVGRLKLPVPRPAVPFLITPGAAGLPRTPPARGGGGRHRGALRGHRGRGVRRRGPAE
jgi:DNA-binding transcriptional LysR family regulator